MPRKDDPRSRLDYRGRTREKVKKMSEGGGSYDSYIRNDVVLFKVKEGDHQIRVLPPSWKGADDFCMEIFVHYGIGPDEVAYLCNEKMNNERCPICEERKRATKAGDEEYADSLGATQRYLIYIIDRDAESDGPLVWAAPKTFVSNLNALCEDKRTKEILQIDDPSEGYDVFFDRKGAGLKTKYEGISIDRNDSRLADDPDLEDDWINFILDNPLPDVLQFYPPEHIEKSFMAMESSSDEPAESHSSRYEEEEEEEEEEEDARSSRRGSRRPRDEAKDDDRSSRRRSRHDEEEEEEEEEEKEVSRGLRGLRDRHQRRGR